MQKLTIKNITIISIILHIVCAIFSSGFHHYDEHFQIYEFLNYKLGNSSASDLPWEFREQIRPWFQVSIYYIIYNFFSFIGIKSPFAFAFIFRLFTTLFGFYALYSLLPVIRKWFTSENYQKLAWALLNFSWFVPYIQTRTSSESFGISFFLLGLSQFIFLEENNSKKKAFISGLLFGLSYLSRSQMAISVAFLWFWSLIYKKIKLKTALFTSLGIIFVILLGVLIDSWGYGNFTFSTWHYFRTNFLEGIFARVKHYPWYWYFRWSLLRGIPPVSIPFILATLWGWYKLRKHPLTWITLPMFFAHSLLGHKELRYIFPVIILTPIYLTYFISYIKENYSKISDKVWFKGVQNFIITLNIIILIGSCLRAANPSVKFYQWIWNQKQITELHALHEDPFTMLGLKLNFYKRPDIKVTIFKDKNNFNTKNKYIYFNRGNHLLEWESRKDCNIIFTSYPRWTLDYNIGNWLSRSRVWSIFKCD